MQLQESIDLLPTDFSHTQFITIFNSQGAIIMNSLQFREYKKRHVNAIKLVLEQSKSKTLDEAAFPAYSHTNPLINWLFWQRIKITMDYLKKNAPYDVVLDFGCGSGVMLPFLSTISKKVIAMDIDFGPLEKIKEHLEFPDNIVFVDAREIFSNNFNADLLDAIISLDVLEHVDDLGNTLKHLYMRLRPDGALIISGPTENLFYKIGRRIAGPEYSGDYHERDVSEIKKALSSLATVKHIASLYPPISLFEIFIGVNNKVFTTNNITSTR
ncbi:MAG: class I SAM-dependent methyltransferase [Chloroflexi bacterium]|nr:class I SAM-dependent methyltransferase [Chloroflexota bacterium]